MLYFLDCQRETLVKHHLYTLSFLFTSKYVCAPYPETKVEHSVLLVDALPGLDYLRKEGLDYIQVSWFQDVVLRPCAEHFEGPSQSSTHLLLAEEFNFGTEAPLGPGRHAVVDGVGGALLQTVHSHRLT